MDPRIVSKAGAMGLMQVMPVTGMFVANYEGLTWTAPDEILFNPVYNIRLGSRLLSSLIEKYNLEGALIAYNGGEKLAATWLTNGRDSNTLWKETGIRAGHTGAVQELSVGKALTMPPVALSHDGAALTVHLVAYRIIS